LDAVIPVLLPLLEALSKIFNGNAVKGHQWFLLNLCNVSKMPPFQILLHPWVQKIVARSETGKWGFGEVGHNHYFVFSQNCWTLKAMCVGTIVMVQEPIPTLSLL
jgi:hypothetical protein